jgi:hypothetical protein
MLNLSPEAVELVRAAKQAYRPSDVDRARVLDALRARLGETVVMGDGILQSAMGARGFWSRVSALAVVGLAVVVGVLWLAWRTEPASSMPLPRAESSVAGRAALPPWVARAAGVPSEPVQESVAPPARQPNPARPAPSRRVRDELSEEVAILSRAETDLYGGRPQRALLALDEHERKFGNGVLAEERTAARIQALCALGRTAEADSELARLARISPNSPHAKRSRDACRMKPSP